MKSLPLIAAEFWRLAASLSDPCWFGLRILNWGRPAWADRLSLRCIGLPVALLVFSSNAFANSLQCSVDGSTSGTEINATVPPEGVVPLLLICPSTGTPPRTLDLIITEFWNETGFVHLNLLLPPDYRPSRGNGPFTVPFNAVIPIRLAAEILPAEGRYAGRLLIMEKGKDPANVKLTLTRAAPTGTLILDRQSVTMQISRPPFRRGSGQEPSFSVTLREKSGHKGMQGITVRLEQASKQPGAGFSLAQNAVFTINHEAVSDLEMWPPKQPEPVRSFGPGGQAVVGVALKNLNPGEYDASLRFQAANSASDDAQKLSLVVQVRDSVWPAIILLFVAVVFSFVATKVVTSLRQRFSFLKRIHELRPAWLSQEPSVLPVVWVRAILKQSEDLSRRYWLTGADSIEATLKQASTMLGVLDRIRRLREQLLLSGLPRLLRIRAMAALNRIVSRLGNLTPTENELAEINGTLTGFANWLQPSTVNDTYWSSISTEITSLCDRIVLGEIKDPEARAAMSELEGAIKASLQQKPQDLQGMMKSERQYAALKILWQWHTRDDKFPDFVRLVTPGRLATQQPTGSSTVSPPPPPKVRDIDDALLKQLFALADSNAWELLKVAADKGSITIKAPAPSELGAIEAYDPLKFEIQSGDPIVDDSYLFQRALEFNWTFRLEYRTGRLRGTPKSVLLTPNSSEPRVVQYAPRAGTLKARVEIKNANGEPVKIPEEEMDPAGVPIAPSTDFGALSGLAAVEIISWALAAIVAIVTGLSMFYYNSPTFGSFKDYISLFLWGAGVDQGKNFLQAMQTYSAPAAKSS